MGSLHGGGAQGCRPLLHYSRLPGLVVHQHSPFPHFLIQPLHKLPASRPPLMGLGRAGPQVGRRFRLRSTEEARGTCTVFRWEDRCAKTVIVGTLSMRCAVMWRCWSLLN